MSVGNSDYRRYDAAQRSSNRPRRVSPSGRSAMARQRSRAEERFYYVRRGGERVALRSVLDRRPPSADGRRCVSLWRTQCASPDQPPTTPPKLFSSFRTTATEWLSVVHPAPAKSCAIQIPHLLHPARTSRCAARTAGASRDTSRALPKLVSSAFRAPRAVPPKSWLHRFLDRPRASAFSRVARFMKYWAMPPWHPQNRMFKLRLVLRSRWAGSWNPRGSSLSSGISHHSFTP